MTHCLVDSCDSPCAIADLLRKQCFHVGMHTSLVAPEWGLTGGATGVRCHFETCRQGKSDGLQSKFVKLKVRASTNCRQFSYARKGKWQCTLPEKLANATGLYCDTHNFVAISTFSAMTGDFGCVRVTFCNQNLSVAIKILLVAISRRYHNARFGSLQQGGVFPTENNALHVGWG